MAKTMESKLELSDLEFDPIAQLNLWFSEAIAAGIAQPDAMTLSTATKTGIPSARTVLYKGTHPKGITFYTNYNSPKAHDLDENPLACLVFFWATQARQMRIDGQVEKLSRTESEAYFRTRPRESCLGAWASDQSQPIESYPLLESKLDHFREKFKDQDVPCPPHWGGYVLIPNRFEFWCGRQFRIHDRFLYVLKNGKWERTRLNP
jgi:pyridoxamine 5'-phosphate oxidase